jgi:hypothetical protein
MTQQAERERIENRFPTLGTKLARMAETFFKVSDP